jgi:hypothetical protein
MRAFLDIGSGGQRWVRTPATDDGENLVVVN